MPLSLVLTTAVVLSSLPTSSSDAYVKPFGCTTPGTMTDDLREKALNAHNDLRLKVAEGNEQANTNSNNPSWLPEAENMYKLIYSCDLELAAANLAMNCQGAPVNPPTSNAVHFKYYDTNAMQQVGADSPLETEIKVWIGQVKAVAWPKKNIFDAATYGSKLQEYADMIRADNTAVGCYEAICGAKALSTVACVYEKPKVADQERIYISGEVCTSDQECTTYTPSTCGNDGLCMKGASNSSTTVAQSVASTSAVMDTQTTAASTTTTINPENQVCPSNTNMTDAIRVKAAQMHNYRRSRVAGGEVKDKNGNLLKKAANMLQLKYVCDLEKSAKEYADRCLNQGSPADTRKGVEENFARIPISVADTQIAALQEGVKSWWRVVRETDPLGSDVMFLPQYVGAPISSVTRIAWANTKEFGCGVSRCDLYTNIVCHYRPGGNIVGQPVYEIGSPCGNCPATYPSCSSSLCVSALR